MDGQEFLPPLLKVMRREKFGLVHLLQTERKRRRCHLLRSIGRAAPPLLCRPECLSSLLSLSFRKEGDGSNPTIFDDFSRSLLAFKNRVSPSRDHRYPNTVFSGVIGLLDWPTARPFYFDSGPSWAIDYFDLPHAYFSIGCACVLQYQIPLTCNQVAID